MAVIQGFRHSVHRNICCCFHSSILADSSSVYISILCHTSYRYSYHTLRYVQVFRRPRVIHTFWRVTVNSKMSRLPTVRNFSSRNKRQSLSSATARRSFEAYEPGVALGETGIYHATPPADGDSFSDSEEEESISSGFNDFSFNTSLPLERDRSHVAVQYGRTSTPTTTVTPNLQRTPLITRSDNSQVISMLQQQQSVLQQVLDSQKKLQDRQNTIEEQLHELQKKSATPPLRAPVVTMKKREKG